MYESFDYQPRDNVDTANIHPDTYKNLAGVTWCDDNFDRLLKAIEVEGIKENTIVVFTSDHGEMLNSHGDFNEKTYWWKETAGIPMIIRWPNKLKTGKNEMLFSVHDFMPTLLGLMGVQVPDVVEGKDWSQTLMGHSDEKPSSAFIAHYPYLGYDVPFDSGLKDYHTVFTQGMARLNNGYGDLSQIGFRGVTTGKYTYVIDKCPKDEPDLSFNWRNWRSSSDYDVQYDHPGELVVREFFFDNESDPYQINPIPLTSEAYQEEIQYMKSQLKDWLEETHDNFRVEEMDL